MHTTVTTVRLGVWVYLLGEIVVKNCAHQQIYRLVRPPPTSLLWFYLITFQANIVNIKLWISDYYYTMTLSCPLLVLNQHF